MYQQVNIELFGYYVIYAASAVRYVSQNYALTARKPRQNV